MVWGVVSEVMATGVTAYLKDLEEDLSTELFRTLTSSGLISEER